MTSSDIVIKIYNQRTLRVDLGEKMIREYAMNVAKEAYLRGHNDGHQGKLPRPEIELSELNPDNYNEE
jgi:hypothetical protein